MLWLGNLLKLSLEEVWINHVDKCVVCNTLFSILSLEKVQCHLYPSVFCLDGSLVFDGVWHLFGVWYMNLQSVN